ncbi:MAG: NAD(P)H-hydrate dehydratase [Bacteroidales bacterium]
MKIFKSSQVKDIDACTIKHEPISSPELMERASKRMASWIVSKFDENRPVFVIAGPGNNGGDGLVVARLLAIQGFSVTACLLRFAPELSPDCQLNFDRLKREDEVRIIEVHDAEDLPEIPDNALVADAIFGAGLTRPVKGLAGQVIDKINGTNACTIAIDAPSGLFGEDNSQNNGSIIRADYTLALQFPNRSFFFKENRKFTGEFYVIDIGLHPDAIKKTPSDWFMLEDADVASLLHTRNKFDHKGNFGHALLIAGSYGKMGAAVLASKACLRAGVGLLTVHIPKTAYTVMQQAVPEAMLSIDHSELIFTDCDSDIDFDAIGIGPGLDTKHNTQKALQRLIESSDKPMVLDADALNIIAENKYLLEKLPAGTILTPHPKEFQRLFGHTDTGWTETELLLKMAGKYNIVVVLKSAFTRIATPEGKLYINPTGNPGMATAGSGDVLTGIVLSLLAQEYEPANAACVAVYIHGKAGDAASRCFSQEAMIAGDIPEFLGQEFKRIVS